MHWPYIWDVLAVTIRGGDWGWVTSQMSNPLARVETRWNLFVQKRYRLTRKFNLFDSFEIKHNPSISPLLKIANLNYSYELSKAIEHLNCHILPYRKCLLVWYFMKITSISPLLKIANLNLKGPEPDPLAGLGLGVFSILFNPDWPEPDPFHSPM